MKSPENKKVSKSNHQNVKVLKRLISEKQLDNEKSKRNESIGKQTLKWSKASLITESRYRREETETF